MKARTCRDYPHYYQASLEQVYIGLNRMYAYTHDNVEIEPLIKDHIDRIDEHAKVCKFCRDEKCIFIWEMYAMNQKHKFKDFARQDYLEMLTHHLEDCSECTIHRLYVDLQPKPSEDEC